MQQASVQGMIDCNIRRCCTSALYTTVIMQLSNWQIYISMHGHLQLQVLDFADQEFDGWLRLGFELILLVFGQLGNYLA